MWLAALSIPITPSPPISPNSPMPQSSDNNKRIAKNTIFMYIRTFITMIVSLYTSRVVLETLGVEDFGIYNIVGGVVVLFTFINSAMATGTQRHLSYELGKPGQGNVTEVFSACVRIHAWLALAVVALAETVGLWFLNTKMNFPPERMDAVNWVYQFSVMGCAIGILRVPYQSSIVAHERMSFYAYMGIIEACLKLSIVYLLLVFAVDKLKLYSILTFAVIVLVTVWYVLFCHKSFGRIRIGTVHDKHLYKRIVSFSGWAMFGSVANLGLHQGLNVIINIFYGVALNAAVGIANQVNSAVMSFVGGFQQALNPQLVKSQAGNDRQRQFRLICESSKLSFLIMFVVAFPLAVNLEYVLSIWLGHYPPHTASICRLIITGALIECLSGPLWVTIFATGNIKAYQVVISVVLLLNVPISYAGGCFGMTPESMFMVRNAIYVLALTVRLMFLQRMISLDLALFTKKVIVPISMVLAFGALPICAMWKCFDISPLGLAAFIVQTSAIVAYEVLVAYRIGLSPHEREYVKNMVVGKLKGRNGNR